MLFRSLSESLPFSPLPRTSCLIPPPPPMHIHTLCVPQPAPPSRDSDAQRLSGRGGSHGRDEHHAHQGHRLRPHQAGARPAGVRCPEGPYQACYSGSASPSRRDPAGTRCPEDGSFAACGRRGLPGVASLCFLGALGNMEGPESASVAASFRLPRISLGRARPQGACRPPARPC